MNGKRFMHTSPRFRVVIPSENPLTMRGGTYAMRSTCISGALSQTICPSPRITASKSSKRSLQHQQSGCGDQTSHMPKLPPIRSRELLRILTRIGFQRHKETGSAHIVLAHPDGRRTTVSRHNKTIPRGTLGAILRDMNLSAEEFLAMLKERK